jgi:hypothetical protein
MKLHQENQKCLVDIYNYKTKEVDKVSGTITGITTALDREYRVNAILDNGKEIREAAPECIHPKN